LHGQQEISTIQQETISALHEGKSLWRNLMNYGITLGLLILSFNLLTNSINPALILVSISLCIFFIYHSIFQSRKQHSLKRNLSLFIVITGIAVMGVLGFLFLEFDGTGLLKTLIWSALIMGVAVPVYLNAVKNVLLMDSTLTTFFSYSLKLIALMSVLWIPLALALKVYRPDVAVFFFLDDLIVIAICAFILSMGLKKLAYLKAFLKNNF
jgi:CDP-diglyceride synthetase